ALRSQNEQQVMEVLLFPLWGCGVRGVLRFLHFATVAPETQEELLRSPRPEVADIEPRSRSSLHGTQHHHEFGKPFDNPRQIRFPTRLVSPATPLLVSFCQLQM